MNTITIGMPVFNDIDFIHESIDSILNQDYNDFILVISDDGSTDGCETVCQNYASRDKRIIYIRQPINLGISKNMEFLLSKSETEFFMWAADDDLWSIDFISKLIQLLKKDKIAVCAFCDYYFIDENNNKISDKRSYNYNESNSFKRLKKFISNSDDGFGYGVFRTDLIKKVEFPIWRWPNKHTAYNNIYPSLCYYLSKGQYLHCSEPLFFKRVKTENKINHILSGEGNAIKETFSYILRRFNLVCSSSRMIFKGKNLSLVIIIFPFLFFKWFLSSTYKQLSLAGKSFFKHKILRIN